MPRAESKSMDSAASSAAETKTEENDFDENELLMYVAAVANEHLFGEKSELTQFVAAHAADFETALDGDRTGAGTPIKQAERWRSAHREYAEIVEEILEAIVKKNNGAPRRPWTFDATSLLLDRDSPFITCRDARGLHEGREMRVGRRRGVSV